jgi:hypothetical protein
MSEKENNKSEDKKVLSIELKEEVQTIIEKYCKAAGIALDDLGYSMGYLHSKLGRDPAAMEQLMFVFQLYFFSGVYYAKETKEFSYVKLSKDERNKKAKEFLDKLENGLMKGKKKDLPTYMG